MIDFQKFHCGKITLEAYERLKDKIVTEGTRLPWYLKDTDRYLELLEDIIDANDIREFCGDGTATGKVMKG